MKKKWVQVKGAVRKNLLFFLGIMALFCFAGAVQAADSRFQEVEGSNGSILRDNTTGLEWQRCPYGKSWTGSDCSGTAWKGYWDNAVWITDSGGFRLPTIDELRTLHPYDRSIFSGGGGSFWSSTPDQTLVDRAWAFHFGYGHVTAYNKSINSQARLVRVGQ